MLVMMLGKKVNSKKNINYQHIKKWIVPVVSRIYRQTHSVSIPVCNENHKQCPGEEEQFTWSLEYINGQISSLYSYVMYSLSVFLSL